MCKESETMLEKESWEKFRETGLLWWVNRALHLLGWAICTEIKDGKVVDVYPARCKFRGFSESDEEKGFMALTKHLKENINKLVIDTGVEAQDENGHAVNCDYTEAITDSQCTCGFFGGDN